MLIISIFAVLKSGRKPLLRSKSRFSLSARRSLLSGSTVIESFLLTSALNVVFFNLSIIFSALKLEEALKMIDIKYISSAFPSENG